MSRLVKLRTNNNETKLFVKNRYKTTLRSEKTAQLMKNTYERMLG